MKRILICLSIASLSIFGVYAQEDNAKESQDLKAYKQQIQQELNETILMQKKQIFSEAEQRMQAKNREAQNEVESRRADLMQRPEKMSPLNRKLN